MTTPDDDRFIKALGLAVIHDWGGLPQDIQHRLFEQAVSDSGEFRDALALFLHEHHPRTADGGR